MTEWRETTLGAVCSLRAGSAFKTTEQGAKTGELPFIKVSDMNLPANQSRILEANNWVSADQAHRLRAKAFPPGTTVFAKIGEALKQNRVRFLVRNTVIDNNMMGAVPHELQIDGAFLFHLLRTVNLAETASGTAVPYLTVNSLQRTMLRIPDLHSQRRIARVLLTLDDLIENNRRRIELLEQMAQAVYREWFVHFRYPGHEDAAFVESPRGRIPEGWVVEPLGMLATLDRSSVHPRRSPDEAFDHYSIPAFDDGRLPVLDKGEAIKSGKFSLTRPAVMVSKLNPRIERTWFVEPAVDRRSVASTEFLILRPKAHFSLEFLYLLARSTNFQERMRELSGGTSTSHQRAKPNDFLQIDVLSPPPSLADRFAHLVTSPLRMTRVLRGESRALVTIRDLLLPKLVTGRIDVTHLDLTALTDSVA